MQASTKATKALKDTQDIEMTNNVTTSEDSTVDVHFPPHSSGKAKHPSQIKTSSKHTTVIMEPSIGDPIPSGQAIMKINGHMPDPGDIGRCEFLIKGAPNPPDLEGIEEEQLLQIQQNIQDKLKQKDEERERNITKRMKQYEEKCDFINKALLESIMHITERLIILWFQPRSNQLTKWSCGHCYLMVVNLKWQNNTMKDLINTSSFKLRVAILRIQL